MKKLFIFLMVTLSMSLSTYSQTIPSTSSETDSIEIKLKSGVYRMYQNGQLLNQKSLQRILKVNPQAYQQFRSAKSSNTFATVLSYAGGFLIGWPLGTAIGGGKPNWAIAGIGAGLVGLSIPISIKTKRKFYGAIKEYNANSLAPTQ